MHEVELRGYLGTLPTVLCSSMLLIIYLLAMGFSNNFVKESLQIILVGGSRETNTGGFVNMVELIV